MSRAAGGLLLALLTAASLPARALPVNLSEAVAQALARRTEVRIGGEQVASAEARVREVAGEAGPTLDVSVDGQRIENYDAFSGFSAVGLYDGRPYTIEVEKELPRYQTSASLTLGYNLYDGGRNAARAGEAGAALEEAAAGRERSERRVIREVARAHVELRKAQIAYLGAVRDAELLARTLGVVREQVRQGFAKALDLTVEELNHSERQVAVDEARRSLLEKLDRYREAIGEGRPPAEPAPPPELTGSPRDLEGLRKPEEGPDPRLRIAAAKATAAGMRVRSAGAGQAPTVNLAARYSVVGRDEESPGGALADLSQDAYVVGVTLNYRLFDSGRSGAAVELARAEERRAALELEQARAQLEAEQGRAAYAVARARGELDLAERRRALAEQRRRIMEVQFGQGEISETAYLRARVEAHRLSDRALQCGMDLELAELEAGLGE